jgi:dolichol-phosphate mannosyltransferase
MMLGVRLAVVIPTWNEAGNIGLVLDGLFRLPLDLRVLVLDDGSTDGTLEALAARPEAGARLEVIRRQGPRGYGRASREGLARALGLGFDLVCQMDGDLSHDPVYLPAMIEAAAGADLVLGSRYVNGVSVVNWSMTRLLLSTAANHYVRLLAGLAPRDCTTGFRLWRRELLLRLDLGRVRSEGYSFLVETLYLAAAAQGRIAEVPIVFVERKSGESKLDARVLAESALRPWQLLGRRLLRAIEGPRR